MSFDLDTQAVSIVFVGRFKPLKFAPTWFAQNKLIRMEEATQAKIEIISEGLSLFSVDWLKFRVTKKQMVVETNQEAFFEPLRDLAVGVLRLCEDAHLSHFGVNREFTFKTKSVDEWHKIGHTLVPKDLWMKLFDRPGMLDLKVHEPKTDPEKGFTTVRVRPLEGIENGIQFYKVNIFINNHHDFTKEDDDESIRSGILSDLRKHCLDKLQQAEDIALHVINLGA